ncbi:MFS monocarboxylate transporter [Fusarium beomiforme]|uniref:MFS monocarboxylate transporter n=1 Tax=Fusarium beomiforme TaxID=44412 RepID=A0A9P5AHB9_9HYPO|nr:MFS monocarboxylate transporter [Fusarium beomiforme]
MRSTSSIDLRELQDDEGGLHSLSGPDNTHRSPEGHPEFSLPPVDGGKDAWLFLFASFFLEALVWGFPFSFGIFQDYYRSHEPFAGSPGIATIGTCALGIMYFAFPIAVALQRLYPRLARWSPTVGIMSLVLVLIASSFSQNVIHLILTQGVLYALAASLAYCPCMAWLEEWFVQRRGLAFGIMWSGTGTGGVVIPFILESLLQRYGFRTTLRIWAVGLMVLSTPAFFFVKPRIPASSAGATRLHLRFSFIFSKTFIVYQAFNIIESLGYFLPAIYLPSYARSVLQTSPFLSTVTIMIINAAMALGIFIMGIMVDKWHITTCILVSTIGAVLATFFLWGFAGQLALLYVYCVFYGLFAGAYCGTWPGMSRQIALTSATGGTESDSPSFDPAMVTGFLIAGRGIGNIASGPLSEALFKASSTHGSKVWGLGGYGPVIAFTGITALGGGASFVWRMMGRL